MSDRQLLYLVLTVTFANSMALAFLIGMVWP